LRPPGGLRNPGLRDGADALRREAIGATGRLRDPALFVRLPAHDTPIARSGLHRLRARLAERLSGSGPGGGLLRALALGDRGGLAAEDREAFGVLGLSHLLAVSGLHLGLAAAGVFAGLRRAAARVPGLAARTDVRGVALAGAAGAALGFALLAGWGVPVRRALVLLLGLAAGFAVRRPLPPLGPLAVAALWILAFDPLALFAPGAQLSFAATAALVLGLRVPGVSRNAGMWSEGLRASATALAVTAPLAALHWGAQAPLALVANAVAVPWTAFVLLPASLAAAACAALGEGSFAGGVVAVAERSAAFSLAAVQLAAARAPGLASGPRPAAAWLASAALLGLLALRVRSTSAKAGVALAVAGILARAPAPPLLPLPPRVIALDVAQGDALLVEGRGAALLVDGGTALPTFDLGRRAVVPALRALGVERLDLVVASHGDLDHRGGLVAVVRALLVDEVWLLPGGAPQSTDHPCASEPHTAHAGSAGPCSRGACRARDGRGGHSPVRRSDAGRGARRGWGRGRWSRQSGGLPRPCLGCGPGRTRPCGWHPATASSPRFAGPCDRTSGASPAPFPRLLPGL
jgi:competence protein ComEC